MSSENPFEPPPAPTPDVAPTTDAPAFGDPYGMSAGGTPELASWGTRVGGALIDGVISFVAQSVVGVVNEALGQLVGIAIFLYFQYRQGTTGRTPGKEVMKIRLVRERDGQVVGFGTAVVRSILHIVDVLPLFLGLLWPLWDPKKQTFADKIMGTLVVKD